MRWGKRKTGRKGLRSQRVMVLFLYVPESMKDNYELVQPQWVQAASITKRLTKGYDILDDNCNFCYNRYGIARFYKKVGLM